MSYKLWIVLNCSIFSGMGMSHTILHVQIWKCCTWTLHCYAFTRDDQLMKKSELILWKLSFIRMKILNDVACNLNSDSILEKWDANWCRGYWKFIHDYNVEKNYIYIYKYDTCSKKKPFHSSLLENWLNRFWFGTIIAIFFKSRFHSSYLYNYYNYSRTLCI